MLTPAEVLFLQDESRKIHIEESIVDYMIQIVNRTRQHPEIELGISPRGTVALFRATQALAMVEGRSFRHSRRRQEARASRVRTPPGRGAKRFSPPPAGGGGCKDNSLRHRRANSDSRVKLR